MSCVYVLFLSIVRILFLKYGSAGSEREIALAASERSRSHWGTHPTIFPRSCDQRRQACNSHGIRDALGDMASVYVEDGPIISRYGGCLQWCSGHLKDLLPGTCTGPFLYMLCVRFQDFILFWFLLKSPLSLNAIYSTSCSSINTPPYPS